MANFLKLNKSYLGPEVLSNGSFEEYGPDLVINGDFATDSNWSKDAGWSINNGKATYDGSATTSAISQALSIVSGKIYKLEFTVEDYVSGTLNAFLSNGSLGLNSITANGTYSLDITATGTLCVFRSTDSFNGSVTNVSVQESGAVELVDNGQFTGIANGTDVTTLPQWSTNNLASANIVDNALQAISSSNEQLVKLNIPTVIGTEYKFNVASVTGDLADNSISIWNVNGSAAVDVDVTSGSGSLTFVADATTTQVNFFAGNRSGVKQTNYTGISLQATNQFAYGYLRLGSGQYSVFNLQAKTVRFVAESTTRRAVQAVGSTTANQEYLVKIDVAEVVGSAPFVYWNGSTTFIKVNLKVGENEIRYKRVGTSNGIYFGIEAQDASQVGSSITLNSISWQEVVNQPKLIGVDNVSMVSAPTDNTVVINNGLTDGADTLTITYAGASASSRVQMRNFFQDSIIRLANGNNTAEVLEITPPVLITDIVAS